MLRDAEIHLHISEVLYCTLFVDSNTICNEDRCVEFEKNSE